MANKNESPAPNARNVSIKMKESDENWMSRFFQDFSFFSPSGYGRTTVFEKDRILNA
ncbi:hypothetical protein LEP1GSC185_1725 [Leptospira licerasiae serovar Varillal str. VAR 010]|uniref:Uncharacterized protein n=1 Tax=Leptospira licerasiae str. MMD4847 TaxID=1049971 RepID=A0ABP2R8M5_9LEPT|nr:hypothetical protein LEP1GSC185_1725 [Leptospira licerasiae serovar Varillal str. VAR 010]EJZ40627.1 hypothetical protein LEP1GSC178_0991 [Leptospira licerasiae str. MMD4847]